MDVSLGWGPKSARAGAIVERLCELGLCANAFGKAVPAGKDLMASNLVAPKMSFSERASAENAARAPQCVEASSPDPLWPPRGPAVLVDGHLPWKPPPDYSST